MPVKVHCPQCAKELNAPEEMLGKTVACPRCNERFWVEQNLDDGLDDDLNHNNGPAQQNAFPPGFDPKPRSEAAGQTPDMMPQPTPPPVAGGFAPVFSKPANASPPRDGTSPRSADAAASSVARIQPGGEGQVLAGDAARAPVPPPPPASASSPPGTRAIPPPPPPADRNSVSRDARGGAVEAASPTNNAAPAPPPAWPKDAAPSPKRRTVQSARFITAGEAATHVRLGADGQLPQLVLQEGKQREKVVEERQGTSPLLVAAMLVSVAVSIAILFIPDQSQQESATKQKARYEIRKHYLETSAPIDPAASVKPYQYYLGQALQAHSRGDYDAEMRNYRYVMNLLKAEGKSETLGLTGRLGMSADPDNPPPAPNDADLEKQLRILLRTYD